MSVADAAYMSSAIPFFFAPHRLRISGTKVDADLVDGGVTSGFPIWVFDVGGTPSIPTFGFMLVERPERLRPIRNLLSFAWNVIQTGIGSADKILGAHNDARTIRIPSVGIEATNFDLPPEQQEDLFKSGYEAADQFLQQFSWAQYVTRFRA